MLVVTLDSLPVAYVIATYTIDKLSTVTTNRPKKAVQQEGHFALK